MESDRTRRMQGLKKLISAQVAEGKLTHEGGHTLKHRQRLEKVSPG